MYLSHTYCMRERERGRDRVGTGEGAETEGDRGSKAGCADSREPDVGLELTN